MGRRFEPDRAHLYLSVKIVFLKFNCQSRHSSVTYLSLLRLKRGQDPAYRATLLLIRWAQVKTALTFLHFGCTSCYITCRRFRCVYGESMGKYGQFYGQLLTTNNFAKLFVCQLVVVAYRATLLPSRWAQLKTLITFLIYLKQFVTLPISNSL